MNRLKNDWLLYLLLVPVLAWYLIFCYAPMGGLVLAFKDYSFKLGIWDSPWIGMGNFTKMFSDRYFLRGLKNTLVFGIGGILISMPCEIALALMLNELRLRRMKKFVQTTVTFPHFISWVVLAGILTNIFASTGAINQILRLFGMSAASPITSESGYRLVYLVQRHLEGKWAGGPSSTWRPLPAWSRTSMNLPASTGPAACSRSGTSPCRPSAPPSASC